jgi:ribonuclease HI
MGRLAGSPGGGNVESKYGCWLDFHTKSAGIGVIVRDSRGQPIISKWKFILYCASAEEAEVLACLEGLKNLINLRQWPAFLESNCLRAVSTLHHAEQYRSGSWVLYKEAREFLKLHEDIVVQKVDRVSNGAAHALAQLGKSGSNGLFRGAAPACVQELVTKDCNTM